MKRCVKLARGMAGVVDRIRTDVLRLLRTKIEARVLILSVAVNNVRIARIGDHEPRLTAAGGIPVARPDHALVVETRDGKIGIVLLRAVNVVRKAVIRRDVVELAGGLIVLGRPGVAAVERNARAAIVGVDQTVGIIGIDPKRMMIAMRRGHQIECLAAIDGAQHAGIERVHRIDGVGIGINLREVPGALAHAPVIADPAPLRSAIVRAV